MKNGLHIDKKGTQYWYVNGKLHREDGPAITKINGDKDWFINGKLHREDGPAIIYANNTWFEWWQYGKLHRLDGPAIIYPDGNIEFWINNQNLTEIEFKIHIIQQNLKSVI